MSWSRSPLVPGAEVEVQLSAHGRPLRGQWLGGPHPGTGTVVLEEPARRVAPGQAVVLYAPGSGDDGEDDEGEVAPGGEVVLGGGTAA